MKKMIYLFILVFSLSTLVACSDDEGTPVFTEPTEFVLNVPKYASGIYDLKNTATIQLTCSQPDYGFTAATRYTVEIALDQAFEKNATLDTKYSTAKMEVDAQEVAVAISNLLGVNEDEFPKAPIPLYVRLTASALTDNKSEIAGSTITSNIIELPQVLPYYALPAVTLPTNLYLIGSVCDWDWSKCYSMIPVHSNEGMFWSMQYLGADADGNKAAFKLNTATSWDNNQVGIQGVTISEASKKLVDAGGEDNIEIGNPGWYIVVVKVTLEGRNYKYAVDFYKPEVYLTGDTSGGWDSFTEANMFTVPEGKGEFVSPAFVASGEVRMCIKAYHLTHRHQQADEERKDIGVLGVKGEGLAAHRFPGHPDGHRLPPHDTEVQENGTENGDLLDHFAVLMKLRLSHRYLMPDTAVTMATSQHSRMDTSTTTVMLSSVPFQHSAVPKK